MDNNIKKVTIKIDCINCGKEQKIKITQEQYKELLQPRGVRRSIQEILPNLKPELREMFISQIYPECWNKLFKEHENDFDE